MCLEIFFRYRFKASGLKKVHAHAHANANANPDANADPDANSNANADDTIIKVGFFWSYTFYDSFIPKNQKKFIL